MAITIKNDARELLALLPPMPTRTQTWHCFSSPTSMCAHVQRTEYFWCKDFQAKDANNVKFRGAESVESAIKMCLRGWPEGAERVAKLRDKINAAHPVSRQYAVYGVAGAIPNVQRCIAGNPQHMKRLDTARARQRPVITLINHMGGLATVSADCFLNKCAVIAAVIDSIEAAGYSCHLIGASQVTNASGDYLCGTAVTIKEAGDALDIGRVAFGIGHVAMLRRILFGVRSSDTDNKQIGDGMGTTAEFGKDLPAHTYLLPSINLDNQNFKSEALAATVGLNGILNALARQDCPAFPQTQAA